MTTDARATRMINDLPKREALADIIGSAGWEAFIAEVVNPFVRYRRNDALHQIKSGDLPKAQACLAAAEAGIEIIFGAYEGTGQEVPEEVRAIRHLGLET